jgi:putative DNA primase/helicase
MFYYEDVESKKSIQVGKIPEELKVLSQWVAWKLELRDGKLTKIPINPKTGYNAASDNPETWASFDKAMGYYEQHKGPGCEGIGFMFSKNDPYTGVDLDKCTNAETGEIEPWAQEIINQLNSYTEFSPSATGVHILVRGELPEGGRKRGHVEMYSSGRYFTVTGKHLNSSLTTIEDRDGELKALHGKVFEKPEKKPEKKTEKEKSTCQPVNLNDENLITKAQKAANGEKFKKLWQGDYSGYPSQSEADGGLCQMLAFWTGKDEARMDRLFRQSGLMRPKWDEKHYSDGKTYGQGVIQGAIENTTETYTGTLKTNPEEEVAKIIEGLTKDTPKPEVYKCLPKLVPVLSRMTNFAATVTLEGLQESLKLDRKIISALEKDIKIARKAHDESEGSEDEVTLEYSANFLGLIDLVLDDGKVAFLVKEADQLKIIQEVDQEGVTLVPPPMAKIPFPLPRGQEVIKAYQAKGNDVDLYDDLVAYHKGISELPGEAYYDLIVAWELQTYLTENFQYSPIICFFAVPERGKSRTGKAMINLAYRGIRVESIREPYIFRTAEHFRACLFFDVMDVWKKTEKSGSQDILLNRFEKGVKVPRVLYPEKGPFEDTVYFDVFGPTIIATNAEVHKILETRAIQINMPQTNKPFENDVTPEAALPFKERLLAFRAKYLDKPLPDVPKPASGRLGDILKPILQIIHLVKPEREGAFLNLVKEIEVQRQIEKANSLEAQILKAIQSAMDETNRGVLALKVITQKFNEGKGERFQFTEKRMGGKLRSLGFKMGSTGTGAAAIIWDDINFEKLLRNYGLYQSSERSDSSEAQVPRTDDSDFPEPSERSLDWAESLDLLLN